MVNVAVTGGNGNVGRAIVEAIRKNPNHKVIVLTRKAPSPPKPDSPPTFEVDYLDVDGNAKLFAEQDIHTVISAIRILDENADGEIKVAEAAVKSGVVKRFVASDWGVPTPKDKAMWVPQHIGRGASLDYLRTTGLEWTVWNCGFFLDYFGPPWVASTMTPMSLFVDIGHRAAAIPGTGDDRVAFTYTLDLARFVVASLDLAPGEWPETTVAVGGKATYNEVVKLAEEATGDKFAVTYDSLEKMERGEVGELPGHVTLYKYFPKPAMQGFLSMFGRYVVAGIFDLPEDQAINKKFPEIVPTTVPEMIANWKGKGKTA